MVNDCKLCKREFEYPYLLKRHMNNKIPCNVKKKSFNCDLCKSNFTHKSDLERHKKTKKHISNYNSYITNIENQNIHNGDNIHIDNSIHIHITKINSFIETNLNVLNKKDIEKLLISEDDINNNIKEFIEYPDEIYGSTDLNILIFKFFIKIFTKLNFIFCNQKILAG